MSQSSNGHNRGGSEEVPFWRRKALAEMDRAEWESLCDGCARCCLVKLEDIDTGELAFTSVACRLLDTDACRCTSYANRQALVSDCVPLDADAVERLDWLPSTCAYRLIANGRELRWWHPLISGDPSTVHRAGISVRGRVVSETDVAADDLEDHVADWPSEDPDP